MVRAQPTSSMGLIDMGYWYQVGISYNYGYITSTGTGYTAAPSEVQCLICGTLLP
jgi:hypothetical protein